MGTRAGACRLGDAAPGAVTSQGRVTMGAVPRAITRPPHCCLAWAIGECSRQGEGWACMGTGQMVGGFLSQSESRAPQGKARCLPGAAGRGARGCLRCQVPREALGMCRVPVAPWDAGLRQGWGLGRLSSAVPCSFPGHSPARGCDITGTGHNGSCAQGHHQAAPLLFGLGDR